MSVFRLGLGFADDKDPDLDDFATKVCTKITENAALFPGLPVSVTDLATAQGNFHNALSIAPTIGRTGTNDKNAKRIILVGLLRQDALFIQGIKGMTAAIARLSGFDVIESGPHAAVAVNIPVIQSLSNVAPGKLGVKVSAVAGFKSLEYRTTVGTAAPVHAGTFPSTRDNVLENLPSLQLHTVQCRAVYGSKRYSEWSDPVSHTTT